ncbi:hypothetical protein NE237_023001 [Protea cynaroides]|uniref:Uncharacterized protein n=1 Tax=Protea cynaroides TaxID=273540 RepID=A0A9Q0K504_9MAGN|nr:hypothetical protein NE237_023001 [Protea cynaroides]
MVGTKELNRPPTLSEFELSSYKTLEGGVPVLALEMRDKANLWECGLQGTLDVISASPAVPQASPSVDGFIPTTSLTPMVCQEKGKSYKGLSLESSQGSQKRLVGEHDDDVPIDTAGEGAPSGESIMVDNVLTEVKEAARDVVDIATQALLKQRLP